MYLRSVGSAVAALIVFAVAGIAFAWTAPGSTPPNGNVAAPVNVGTTNQIKSGKLGVKATSLVFDFEVNGSALLGGLSVSGNTLLGSSRYLNWGSTAGDGGYGIRDNAGVLEFKNTGGTWQSLQTVVNNYLTLGGGGWTASGTHIYNSNTGGVGIGTEAPVAKLDVRGSIRQKQGTTYDVWIQGGDTTAQGDTRNLALLGTDDDSGDLLYLNFGGEYSSGTRIGGNVGIGNFTPGIDLAIGDADTGFQWVSDGNFALYTNNTERIRFNSSGNVGIGNTSPAQKLDVTGSVKADGFCIAADCITSWAGSGPWTTSGTNIYNSNTGNVGIGSASPTQKLDITGKIRTADSNGGWVFWGGSNLQIGTDTSYDSSTPPIYVQGSTGNVGIGTNNPASTAQLHVVGGTRLQGNVGVGASGVSSNAAVVAQQTFDDPTGTTYGGYFINYTDTSVDVSRDVLGAMGYAIARPAAGTTNNYTARGIWGIGRSDGAGTMTNVTGVQGRAQSNNADAVITSARGLYSEVLQTSGTITNAYGLYINAVQGTNKWGLYQNDSTLRNYFAGSLGIGTNNPAEKLQVVGNVRADGFCIATDCITSWAGASGSWTASGNNIFNSNTGNVGIGTNAPTQKLQVTGNALVTGSVQANSGLIAPNPNNGSATMGINWLNDVARIRIGGTGAGAVNGLDIQTTGDVSLLRLLHNGNVGIGTNNPTISLALGDSDSGFQKISDGNFALYTNNTERMRFNSSGNVGIGTASPGGKLQVSSSDAAPSVYGYNSGGNYGVYGEATSNYGISGKTQSASFGGVLGTTANGTYYGILGHADTYSFYGSGTLYNSGAAYATSFLYLSDARLKRNVQTMQSGLPKILALRPVTFTWKADIQGPNAGKDDIGFIAQDVEKVLPEAVSIGTDGLKAVDYPRLVPVLVKAMQEQQAEIEALKADVAALRDEQ